MTLRLPKIDDPESEEDHEDFETDLDTEDLEQMRAAALGSRDA